MKTTDRMHNTALAAKVGALNELNEWVNATVPLIMEKLKGAVGMQVSCKTGGLTVKFQKLLGEYGGYIGDNYRTFHVRDSHGHNVIAGFSLSHNVRRVGNYCTPYRQEADIYLGM